MPNKIRVWLMKQQFNNFISFALKNIMYRLICSKVHCNADIKLSRITINNKTLSISANFFVYKIISIVLSIYTSLTSSYDMQPHTIILSPPYFFILIILLKIARHCQFTYYLREVRILDQKKSLITKWYLSKFLDKSY